MKKNDRAQLRVDDMNNLGSGVAHVDGFAVFVPGGVTEDELSVKIIKVTKNYAVGRIEEIITPSRFRSDSRACPVSTRCGGCIYRNISREYELELKQNTVRSALRRAGITDIEVLPVVTDGNAERYRNKAQYPISRDKDGRITLGFYSQKTHEVVAIDDCPQTPEKFANIVKIFKKFADENKLTVYDEISGKGLLRHLYLRSAADGKVSVCIVINEKTLPKKEELIKALTDNIDGICGIFVNINEKNTNVILGDKYECIYGSPYLEDVMCGLKIRLSPASFYQVNRNVAEKLYSIAADKAELKKDETLLDLFCGAGTIGLSMAHKVERLFGVDIVPDAIDNARHNAAANGIENAQFTVADAGDGEALFAAARRALGDGFYAAAVVLDPPRKGCTRELLSAVADHAPKRIVYISCNPDTLARDIVILRELGYDAKEVTPVDMFPGTGHVETVCLLSKLNARQHIEINLDMDELDLTDAEKKATYQEIKDYVLEHSGLKVSSLYIAQVKQKCGIIERENYNKPKSEDAKQPQCPPDKEKAIKEALTHFGMI